MEIREYVYLILSLNFFKVGKTLFIRYEYILLYSEVS